MSEFSSPPPMPLKLQRNEPQFSLASDDFTFGSSSSWEGDSYRISPPIDQLYKPNYDLDTKWRAVAMSNQIPNHFPNHFMAASASNQFIAAHENKKDFTMMTAPSSSSQTKLSAGDYKAPKQPLLLMTTHFITCVPISCIITLVERALLHFSEVSFSMVADDCMWNAVYLRGSAHCNMQIHVYSHASGHIVEASRLSGDSAAFRMVWAQIKALMNNEPVPEPRPFETYDLATPFPAVELMKDEEAVEALKPILQMAKCGLLEPQLEAARIFCDLSLHDAMQHHMCDSGCIQALVENLLTCDICEWTKQHAVLALANLSETQGCQEAMIDAGILPILLELVKDGPYNTAEMRREAARILANLSARLASRVVTVIGARTLSEWLEKVEFLNDERLRLHASRAKESLTVVFTN